MTKAASLSSKPARPLIGMALMVVALQILPVSDTMAKYASQTLPVLQVIWARFFFHCLITGAYCGVKYGRACLMPRPRNILFARAAALFCAVGLFYITMHYLPLTTTLTLWFVEPFILTLMAIIFFGERVTVMAWAAVGLGFAGIILANRPDLIDFHWSYLTGLLAGVGYAVFLLLTRAIDERSPPMVSVYQTGLVGGVISTALVPLVWVMPTPSQWVLMIGIGFFAALAHLFIVWAFAQANASTLAPFTYTEVIAASILGFVVFGDVPTIWTVLGVVLITLSGVFIALKGRPATAEDRASAGDPE